MNDIRGHKQYNRGCQKNLMGLNGIRDPTNIKPMGLLLSLQKDGVHHILTEYIIM